MSLFSHTDYRKGIRWSLERLASRGEKLTHLQLASAMKVQAPYLSKVLSGSADLSEDQLYLACEKLELSAEESRYLQLLLSFARTTVKQRKEEIFQRITALQKKKLSPEENRSAAQLEQQADLLSRYYLDPWAQIIHMYLTIPKWRKDPLALAKLTGLTSRRISVILKTLEDLRIIELKNGSYELLQEQLHLAKSSPLCGPQQTLMKALSLQRLQEMDAARAYTFSATFSGNELARTRIQQAFVEFLKQVEKIVSESPAENVYQVGFDLFPWS